MDDADPVKVVCRARHQREIAPCGRTHPPVHDRCDVVIDVQIPQQKVTCIDACRQGGLKALDQITSDVLFVGASEKEGGDVPAHLLQEEGALLRGQTKLGHGCVPVSSLFGRLVFSDQVHRVV